MLNPTIFYTFSYAIINKSATSKHNNNGNKIGFYKTFFKLYLIMNEEKINFLEISIHIKRELTV